MADKSSPLKPSDSWSTSESTANASTSDPCAEPMPITFRIRLHPQGNKESNKDFSFFQVFCNQSNTKFRAKFAVYNVRNEEILTTVYTGTQQLHGYFEYIRRDLLCAHVLPSDELQLVLNLTVTFDTITESSQAVRLNTRIEPRTEEVTRDLEAFYRTDKLKDFVFVLQDGKELKAHKMMLAARSPVFAAMLEPHTEESQSSRVLIKDVEADVMQEMISYIYTGTVTLLSTLALELLAVADRFALPGLKEMAETYLRGTLTVDSACRNVVYADMHNAEDLKADAIRFIVSSSNKVINTEGWAAMVRDHPTLVTDVVSAISADKKTGNLSGVRIITSGETPAAKRPRITPSCQQP